MSVSIFTASLVQPNLWSTQLKTAVKILARQVVTQLELRRNLIDLTRANAECKRAEEMLQLKDRALAATSNGIVIADANHPNHRIIYYNSAFERLTGYSQDEILGHNCRFLQGPDTDPATVAQIRHALQQKRECRVVLKNYRKDGTPFWNELSISPVQDGSGQLTHFIGVQADITERKRTDEVLLRAQLAETAKLELEKEISERQRAEAALRQAEKKYRSIFENAVEGIFQTTPEGRFISANPALARIYGYESPDELITNINDIGQQLYVKPSRHAQFIRLMQEYDVVSEFESQVYRQDGSTIWILENARAVRDANGDLLCYEGSVEDITERKRAKEDQQKLVSLVENSSDFVGIVTLEGQAIFVNDAGQKLVGLEGIEEVKRTMLSNYFTPEDLSVFQERILPLVMERGRWEGEFHFRHFKTGALIPVQYNFFAIRDRDTGQPIAVATVSRDITERKQAEEEIRNALNKEKELSKLKSRFVTMASHEFRTPLATILSSAELLERYSHRMGEEKKLNHLHRIQAAVNHTTGLLNDVLLIGKAEAGKLEFKPTLLDLVQFCRDLVEEVQITTNTHLITFCSQEQSTNACLDEKLLRQILSNLISNAIKYSPQSNIVHFSLLCEQGEAVFCIQDRGIGIPGTDQSQLFNSFHRASNVGTIQGTGLGLAIVKKSVDLHNGKIAVESEVGVGTKVTVTIPINNWLLKDEKNSID